MVLHEAFPLGCRVQLSRSGRGMRPARAPIGTVVGYSKNGFALRVRRDGRKTVISTWHEHWERVVEDGPRIEEHW